MKQQGYETIVISSGDFSNKIKKADVYLSYSKALTDFENEVLNLTPIPFFLRKLSRSSISKSIVDQYSMHREKVNYVFDALADISKSKKPIFVYAYILLASSSICVWAKRREGRVRQEVRYKR